MRKPGAVVAVLAVGLGISGCGQVKMPFRPAPAPGDAEPLATVASLPAPGTEQSAPPATAVTAEQFDTTTGAERAAAASAAPVPSEARLGTTIASLGDPADPGFWAETGLVTEVRQGRLEYTATGKSVNVELRPSGNAPGSGTRVSLPALRVLEAPLTDLPELVVYGG